MKPYVILTYREGQLGNRLFLSANFLAAQFEFGFNFRNIYFSVYESNFPAYSLVASSKKFIWNNLYTIVLKISKYGKKPAHLIIQKLGIQILDISKTYDSTASAEFDLLSEKFFNLISKNKIVFCYGWKFRAHSALLKHRKTICEVFRPDEVVEDSVKQLISKARFGIDLRVGVHCRLGDYANWQDGRFFYSLDNYFKWMNEVVFMNPEFKVGFLVCSNGDVENLIRKDDLRVMRGIGSAVEDLYALAACDLIIGPPSTFSGWASFYGSVPMIVLENQNYVIDRNYRQLKAKS
jgi:hypothetical protein